MITLITGVPGAGKTLNTLELVSKEWGDSERKIYYRGIRELKLPWEELSDEQMAKWWEFPDNSVFVIDEIQQVFPRRSPNHPTPEGVSRLDTHRHRGFDFYIITQKPKNFDFEARGYVGRHFHYERAFGREATRQLMWQQACDDPGDYHKRLEAEITRVKFNKKFYDIYKSAEVHTHQKKIPKKMYVFAAAILFTGLAFTFVYNSVMGRTEEGFELAQGKDPSKYTTIQGSNVGSNSYSSESPQLTPEEYSESLKPRLNDLPWSAPHYDSVTEVKTFPRPQCIASEERGVCKCYTQQATPLDLSRQACWSIVNHGYFNPFLDEGQELAGAGTQFAPTNPPQEPENRSFKQVVYVGGPNSKPPTTITDDQDKQVLTNQPGAAYRNQFRTAPVQPTAIPLGQRPLTSVDF